LFLLYHNTAPYFYVYVIARFGKTVKEEKYILLSEAARNNNWNIIESDINPNTFSKILYNREGTF